MKIEMSVLRAAAHHQQHETGATLGTEAQILFLASWGQRSTFNRYPAAGLKFCTCFKLGLQSDPRSYLLNLCFAINCVRHSSQSEV